MNMPTLGRDHSSGQLEWFKTNVDEKYVKVGGTQLITTLDGYSVPLLIKDGLAYATSHGKPTDQDMDTYPHVFFTSPDEWDPSVLDHDPPYLDGLDHSQVPDQPFGDPMFDAYGDFNEHIIANLNILLDAPPADCGSYTGISSVFTATLHQSSPQSLTGMLYAHFCMDIPIQHQGHFQCHHQAWDCSTHPGLHQKALVVFYPLVMYPLSQGNARFSSGCMAQ